MSWVTFLGLLERAGYVLLDSKEPVLLLPPPAGAAETAYWVRTRSGSR